MALNSEDVRWKWNLRCNTLALSDLKSQGEGRFHPPGDASLRDLRNVIKDMTEKSERHQEPMLKRGPYVWNRERRVAS